MIPLTLQIKNFLSYGPTIQTIDFSHYPLICLAGKNGHGKSALLDAMTWALWGQARKISGTSKPDQGLLHLGQTQMMVIFDFICSGTHYRVKREFMQTYGKPVTHLEFGTVDANSGAAIPLTDKTIRGTQATIENTLHISFEAFVNSAFLRQGQSHEFSTKSPKERKDILANILGLHDYERLRKYTAEKIKQTLAEKASLELYHQKLGSELELIPAIQVQLEEIETKLQNLQHHDANIQQLKNELEISQKKFNALHQQQQLIDFQVQQLNLDEQKNITHLRATYRQWKLVHAQKCQSSAQQLLLEQKKQLTEQLVAHQASFQQTLTLKEQYLALKEQSQRREQEIKIQEAQENQNLNLALERLLLQRNALKQETLNIELQHTNKTTELSRTVQEHTTNAGMLRQITVDPLVFVQQEKQFEKRKQFYHNLRSQGTWTTNELASIRQKQTLTHDENNPSCPLCEQNLSASRKKFLTLQFQEQYNFLQHRIKRLTRTIAKLKELLITQHATLENAKKTREQEHQLKLSIAEKEKQISTIQQELGLLVTKQEMLNKQIAELDTAIKEAQTQLTVHHQKSLLALQQDTAYQSINSSLEQISAQAKAAGYNAQAHQDTTQKLTTLEHQLALYEQLREQLTLQDNRRQEISNLCSILKETRAKQKKLIKQKEDLPDLLAQEQHINLVQQKITDTIKNVTQEKEVLLHQKGGLQAQQQKLSLITQEHAAQIKKMHDLDDTIYDYQAIAQASSKDGIQALLIEDAIPEIEQEANILLAKLTNNQSHLSIESLRDLKKGGAKETLDIKISDAAGIRPYEMFSGGEAFRIDFALRIAISKLLARRAGTSLQTLIIDEGFGSQDDEGLSHIMDAIHKIQDDFAKVIIVSHMPAMKEQFPVHFYVQKQANGSVVQVIEQG